MPTVYLKPEDVSDAQAAVILDYLNSENDAEAIAARIELENELDIGKGLARRLIQARERLGGRFENLQQVYDVPYIGPERFTEIIVSLLNLNLPDVGLSVTPSYQAVLDELARLRSEVAQLRGVHDAGGALGLNAGRRIQFRVLQKDIFLGQHLTLEIHAFDTRTSQPLVDQPVTLATNWGVLQYQQGYGRQQDAVVEVRTDIQGKARVRLRSPTYESLTQEQQLALEVVLQMLDASAPTPAAIREQLEALVLQYRRENNLELRKAIDIYFNTQKVAIIESVNRRFFSDAWHFHRALISAYIHLPEGTGELGNVLGFSNGFVEGFSTVKVCFKDWVGAWYQTYLDYLENGNQFSERVQNLSSGSDSGGRLINGMLSEISSWTLGELGVAGSIVGEKSTEAAVRKFLADDIQTLPDQQQLQLYSALSVAVKPASVTQIGALQAIADTQLTLSVEIDNRVGSVEDISAIATTVQQGLDSFNSQFGDFQSNLGQFNTDYSAFNSNLTDFNTSYADFNTTYGTFDTQYNDFDSRYATFHTNYNDFDTRYTTFDTQYNSFDTRYVTFDTRYKDFDNRYGSFDGRMTEFNSNYRTFDQRMNQFDSQLKSVNTDMTAVRSDIGKFNVSYTDFNTGLSGINTDIEDLKANVKSLQTSRRGPTRR